jgi:hypothetical protein
MPSASWHSEKQDTRMPRPAQARRAALLAIAVTASVVGTVRGHQSST